MGSRRRAPGCLLKARLQLGLEAVVRPPRPPTTTAPEAVGRATIYTSSGAPGLPGPPLSRKWSGVQLLPGSGRCWPHVPQAEGPGEHRGPPEHPEGLATGCLSARSQGCAGRRGGDAVRCPGPGRSPSRPHRPLRIRRVFLSPMKNLQRHGPVRSLGESPRPSSASPCPHFSRTFQPWWPDPLGAGETLFLEVPPLPSPPGPELPAPRPPSRRLSGDAEGADGGTVGPPAPCTARGKRSRPRARPGGARGGPR